MALDVRACEAIQDSYKKDSYNKVIMLRKKQNEKERKHQAKNIVRAFTLASIVSTQIAGSILLGMFLGRYLDRWLGTEPWLMVGGVLLGLTAGMFGLVKTLNSLFYGQ